MKNRQHCRPLHHRTTLRHHAPTAGLVTVAGTFNDWDPQSHPMTRDTDGVWTIELELERRDHEYKFVVDGRWVHDDLNPEYVVNAFGEINSVFPDV